MGGIWAPVFGRMSSHGAIGRAIAGRAAKTLPPLLPQRRAVFIEGKLGLGERKPRQARDGELWTDLLSFATRTSSASLLSGGAAENRGLHICGGEFRVGIG